MATAKVLTGDALARFVVDHKKDSEFLAVIGSCVRGSVCDGVTSDDELGFLILNAILGTRAAELRGGAERMLDAMTGWDSDALLQIAVDEFRNADKKDKKERRKGLS